MNDYKRLILRGQELLSNIQVRDRRIVFRPEYLDLQKIISFIGPRRAGKTYFMFSVLQRLIREGRLEIQQIVFIDFTSFLYENFDIERLIEEFFALFPEKQPFFVFDEIQELEDFSKVVMYIFNSNYKVFLSGSNSKLLSSELSTIFRGRSIDVLVFPLSLAEFLDFRDFDTRLLHTESQIGSLKYLLREFIDFGAYPEIVLTKNHEVKRELIRSYFSLLLYKDLLERYGIENEYVIKFLIKSLLLSTTKEFRINKIFNDLKSQNIKIGKQTLYTYLEYLKEIFFVKEIHDISVQGNKKLFFYDVGYHNILFLENFGQRFENVIFLELQKRFGDIVYKKDTTSEIDFIIESQDLALQVCYSLSSENIERESKSLRASTLTKKIIVYFDTDRDFQIPGVEIMSFWEFEQSLSERG